MERYDKLYLFVEMFAKPFFLKNMCIENYQSADGTLSNNNFLKFCSLMFNEFDGTDNPEIYREFYSDLYNSGLQKYIDELTKYVKDDGEKHEIRKALEDICVAFADNCINDDGVIVFSEIMRDFRNYEERKFP